MAEEVDAKTMQVISGRIETREPSPRDGSIQIWVCHEVHPQLDTCLATLHYSYAYQDNARRQHYAAQVAELYAELLSWPYVGQTRGAPPPTE